VGCLAALAPGGARLFATELVSCPSFMSRGSTLAPGLARLLATPFVSRPLFMGRHPTLATSLAARHRPLFFLLWHSLSPLDLHFSSGKAKCCARLSIRRNMDNTGSAEKTILMLKQGLNFR
jgi:hypothetical protein